MPAAFANPPIQKKETFEGLLLLYRGVMSWLCIERIAQAETEYFLKLPFTPPGLEVKRCGGVIAQMKVKLRGKETVDGKFKRVLPITK